MTHRTIEQELALHGRTVVQTVGVSMEPLLHGRKSSVVLAAKQGPLQVRDVVLYRRPAGEYVLHRVVKVLDGAYLIRGDNCIGSETVPAAWVIGVMTGYFADEGDRYVSCDSPEYQNYLRTLELRRWLPGCAPCRAGSGGASAGPDVDKKQALRANFYDNFEPIRKENAI